jgi:UDP-N-acetylmuramoylalanine--D-glutamate ligase
MDLRNKKTVVVGLGTTGIATSLFLKSREAQVTVSDIRGEGELAPSIQKLSSRGIAIETGGHQRETFLGADLIVVSPGAPMENPHLKAAAEKGVEIVSEIELASRHIDIPIIAVTGTNGKTTTVNLLADIFKASGKRIFLGGNVGTPLIEYVLNQHREEYIIAEISSFQLEGIKSFKPYISVLLNVAHDHLDRYVSYEEYIAAKMRIFMNQSDREYAILNADDLEVKKLSASINASTLYFSYEKELSSGIYYKDNILYYNNGTDQTRFSLAHINLKGIHNLHNVMAAAAASKLCGCPPQKITQTIEKFKGLPHRLEFLKESHKIKFFNDSKATNVGSVVSALEALDPPLILIAGGKDKGGDYQPLLSLVRKKVKALILLGEAKEKMNRVFKTATPTFIVESLEEAVEQSLKQASAGDTILLSPACSSFDMFKSYEERGNIFKSLVNALT